MPIRRPRKPAPAENTLVRLNKRLGELGLCSRREADEFIVKGQVLVDGVVVNALGSKVSPNAFIELNEAAALEQAGKITVLLHKPAGFVSGQPEHGHKPAVKLLRQRNYAKRHGDTPFGADDLPRGWTAGLAPAGRLDGDSTGLLVFTADGIVAKHLIAPDSGIEKEYMVGFDGVATPESLDRLRHGLHLDGRKLRPAQVERDGAHKLRFILKEGRRRQIRRMCKLVGLDVTALHRVRIGNVRLGGLEESTFRFLREDEIF